MPREGWGKESSQSLGRMWAGEEEGIPGGRRGLSQGMGGWARKEEAQFYLKRGFVLSDGAGEAEGGH